jgi:hypothetical protein
VKSRTRLSGTQPRAVSSAPKISTSAGQWQSQDRQKRASARAPEASFGNDHRATMGAGVPQPDIDLDQSPQAPDKVFMGRRVPRPAQVLDMPDPA